MSDDRPTQPFFLIVANHDRGFFTVEGPMTDDRPWQAAARYVRDQQQRHVVCGLTGPDRDALAAEYRETHNRRRRHRVCNLPRIYGGFPS